MSGAPISVSLIVPVHRHAPSFERCLVAIDAAEPPPAEVLVVCDGHAPEAAELARAHGFRVLETIGPRGPASARNAGARAAAQSILFFVDSDVELRPDTLARACESFERDPDLCAVFGSYDAEPSEPSFLSQYRNLLHHFVHQTSSPNASTFWGACGAIRRDAFLAVSGFDESCREPSIEDVELGYRLRNAGRRILLDKTLQVKHLKRWDLFTMVRTDVLRRALPWGRLILKDPGVARDLNLQAASRWSVKAVAALLASLLFAPWVPRLLWLSALLVMALLLLNRPFYRFLLQKRGALFAARAIPCHFLFYACGGLGFALSIARHLASRSAANR